MTGAIDSREYWTGTINGRAWSGDVCPHCGDGPQLGERWQGWTCYDNKRPAACAACGGQFWLKLQIVERCGGKTASTAVKEAGVPEPDCAPRPEPGMQLIIRLSKAEEQRIVLRERNVRRRSWMCQLVGADGSLSALTEVLDSDIENRARRVDPVELEDYEPTVRPRIAIYAQGEEL